MVKMRWEMFHLVYAEIITENNTEIMTNWLKLNTNTL